MANRKMCTIRTSSKAMATEAMGVKVNKVATVDRTRPPTSTNNLPAATVDSHSKVGLAVVQVVSNKVDTVVRVKVKLLHTKAAAVAGGNDMRAKEKRTVSHLAYAASFSVYMYTAPRAVY